MQGNYRAFWLSDAMFDECLEVIDQRQLPFVYDTRYLTNTEEIIHAIKSGMVRGVGVVGGVAAFGIYIAALEVEGDYEALEQKAALLREAYPSLPHLAQVVDVMMQRLAESQEVIEDARSLALELCDKEVLQSQEIARRGCEIIEELLQKNAKAEIHILTRASEGSLAFMGEGAALAPIYEAKRRGIDLHVWVEETRPAHEGASLSAWELAQNGIKHTIITDNMSGALLQRGKVDMVLVGAQRVCGNGDVVSATGTYLAALGARDNEIPFYVVAPRATFDLQTQNAAQVALEEENSDKVAFVKGVDADGVVRRVRITPEDATTYHRSCDVTPARLITGMIRSTLEVEHPFDIVGHAL